jgi:hypothetical protein
MWSKRRSLFFTFIARGKTQMKRTRLILGLLAIIILAAYSAQANVITLTFEGLGDETAIGNYYNGGAGGNFGITFGPDALAIISGAAGGSGNFSGSPTMPTIAFFLSGPGDVMDVAAGFDTGFSFYYSAVVYPGSVDVYDGLDGTGTLLAHLDLAVTPSGGSPECTYGSYCPWIPVGVAFSGTAQSVVFGGSADYIGFDNITLGSGTPTPGVPEPSTITLLGLGLATGLGGMIRRRRS